MGKVVGRCGERGGEICRKVRRVVDRRREGDVEREVGKFVGKCGEWLIDVEREKCGNL